MMFFMEVGAVEIHGITMGMQWNGDVLSDKTYHDNLADHKYAATILNTLTTGRAFIRLQ